MAQWRRNDLCISSGGYGRTTDRIIKRGDSGKGLRFCFLCGPDFILEIPEDTIDFANRNHRAVFSMPYHVKLIDVTKEIAGEILHSENYDGYGKKAVYTSQYPDQQDK